MDQEKIGKFIQTCRKNKNITQREFAEKLGVTDKTVSRWENGHYLPDVSLFNDICSILDIEVTELLNGEKNKREVLGKEVDKTIMKIVDISSDEIKKKKKKIVIISSVVIAILILIFVAILTLQHNKYESEEEIPKEGEEFGFAFQEAVKEKDDGWVCHFSLSYENNYTDTPYDYRYNCVNFRYSKLDDFRTYSSEIDGNGEVFYYETETNHPSYIYNDELLEEEHAIIDYFGKKKFNKKISMKDLDGLKLEKISKDEVLELYNQAITSEKIDKYGKNPVIYIPEYMNRSMTYKFDDDREYNWIVGYIMTTGHITHVSIELQIDDEYLSDLVKDGKATKEQKEIYDNVLLIKKHIMTEQKFELPESLYGVSPYRYLGDNFMDIKKLEGK